MQIHPFRTGYLKHLFAMFFSIVLLALQARAGGDVYEIYLNNKLVIRQALYEPLNLKSLELSGAKSNDKLSIRFLQCNAPGKTGRSRVISLRDEKGNIVKEWKFKDVPGAGNDMVISVGEFLAIQKRVSEPLFVYYSAKGMAKDQKLAALQPTNKKNT